MEIGGTSPPFLTSALDGGEWSASRPGRFYPREIALGTDWIGGWVGTKAGLDAMEKMKVLSLPGIEPRPPSRQPVAMPTELFHSYESMVLLQR
jgi:hypothetical protein